MLHVASSTPNHSLYLKFFARLRPDNDAKDADDFFVEGVILFLEHLQLQQGLELLVVVIGCWSLRDGHSQS